MKRRFLTLIIASIIIVSMSATNAFAASGSKKKTIYVPIKVVTSLSGSYGNLVNVKTIQYNNKGLQVKVTYGDAGAHEVLKYKKRGRLKSRRFFNNGYSELIKSYSNKKRLVTKEKGLDYYGAVTLKYKYDKRRRLKKVIHKGSNAHVSRYDKYGNLRSETWSDKSKYVYKNVLNKRKDPVKVRRSYYKKGKLKDSQTFRRSYKYDKHGNKIMEVRGDGQLVVEYQYKRLRVSKAKYYFLKWFSLYISQPDTTQEVNLFM